MKNDEPKIIEDPRYWNSPGEEIRFASVDDNMLMIRIHDFLMVARGGAITLNGSKINPDKLRAIAKAMGDVLEFHDRYSGVVWIDSFGLDEEITAKGER